MSIKTKANALLHKIDNDPRASVRKYRIVDSVDGVWIEAGGYIYDGADGAVPYDERWSSLSWSPVGYNGEDGAKHIYDSVEDALKRFNDTQRFQLIKKTTYVEL